MISEGYKTLYECDLDSPLYKLTESYIEDLRKHPEDDSRLSYNLCVLKGLSRLGESAKISESDLPEYDDDEYDLEEDADLDTLDREDVIDEEDTLDKLEGEDVINEEEGMEEVDGEDVIDEDADMDTLDDEDVINEEEDISSEDEESPSITPEELQELKKHLKEFRKARKSKNECKTVRPVKESRSWDSECSSMKVALKNFRESSNKKAFYKSFSKLHERMKSEAPLSLDESILLYKASNSTMTHLAVELEHNPGFIYTFRECTEMLSKDNEKLLECIRKQISPEKSLVESYRKFSSILLESEDLSDEISDEEEDILLDNEDEEIPSEEKIPEEEEIDPPAEEEIPVDEPLEEEEDENPAEGEIPEEEVPLEEEDEDIPAEDEEIPNSDENMGEEEDLEEPEDDADITDEEAEELRKKLSEMRKNRK